MFYVYKHDNDPFLSFFVSMNYTPVKQIPALKKSTNIYYSLRSVDLYVPNGMINILIIDDSIIDIHSLKGFNYYVPTHPIFYLTYQSDFGQKLLLPMNIYRQTNWSTYWVDPVFSSKLGKIKYGKAGSASDSSILIGNTVHSLEGGLLAKRFPLENKSDVFHIHNYIALSHICKEIAIIPITNSIEIKLFLLRDLFNKKILLKANQYYLLARTGFTLMKEHYALKHFLNYPFRAVSFLSKAPNHIHELVLLIRPTQDITVTFVECFNQMEYHAGRIIGQHSVPLEREEDHLLHYYYAKYKQYQMLEYMNNYINFYYDIIIEFISGIRCASISRFHPDKFNRYLQVWSAEHDHPIDKKQIEKFITANRDRFILPRILILGKTINRYGGSQKTSVQLYKELLLAGYDVSVGCIGTTDVISLLDKRDLIYFATIADIERHLQTTSYSYVIINKLDELLDGIDKCISKTIFISHNSMDPVNAKILSVSKNLYKVCTVNTEHQSLLYEHHIQCPVVKYTNYSSPMERVPSRTQFKNRIVYIGRISKEKNIELLLESFTEFTKKYKCELVIVGDGKFDLPITKHVTFVGRQDYHSVLWHLSQSDYLILPSSTEGCPFAILEALQIGIPVITSNIVGCNELITDGYNGFRFDFIGYDPYRNQIDNWDVMEHNLLHTKQNIGNVVSTLQKAYQISIEQWNKLSINSHDFISDQYDSVRSMDRNLQHIFSPKRLLWINSVETSIPCFDTKSNYTFPDLYNYEMILHAPSLKPHPYLQSVLYRIKAEMIRKKISMLYDSNGNYITFHSKEISKRWIKDIIHRIEHY